MKIYLVAEGTYDGLDLLAAFESEDDARAFLAKVEDAQECEDLDELTLLNASRAGAYDVMELDVVPKGGAK